MIEPRNVTESGADAVNRAEGNISCIAMARCARSAGAEERSMFAKGLPRNLGDPVVSTSASRRQRIEAPASSTDEEPANSNSPLPHDEQQSVVPPGERKRARRKGRWEVGAP